MTTAKLLESACFSYPKIEHEENQDSILGPIDSKSGIYMAIADGVGGLSGGAIASTTAIDAIRKEIFHTPDTTIDELFNIAQRSVSKAASSRKNPKEMATTLVICKATTKGFEIGSVGDSRAYFIKNGETTTLTKDQTKKQSLIDREIFTEEELINHYSSKVLTSTINAKNNFTINHYKSPESSGIIILMTDGAYNAIDIKRIVSSASTDLISICHHIKQTIRKTPPEDDFSLVAMTFG